VHRNLALPARKHFLNGLLAVNLALPGAILWHLGRRRVGAAFLFGSLALLPLRREFLDPARTAIEVHLFIGIATGLLGLALAARGDLRR